MWPLGFRIWLISSNTIISSSIHFPAKEMISFLFYGWIWLHCGYILHFICFSVDGYSGWFHDLALVNSAMINTGAQVSLLYVIICWLTFLWLYTRSGIGGPLW
jgi:hypothetical protein